MKDQVEKQAISSLKLWMKKKIHKYFPDTFLLLGMLPTSPFSIPLLVNRSSDGQVLRKLEKIQEATYCSFSFLKSVILVAHFADLFCSFCLNSFLSVIIQNRTQFSVRELCSKCPNEVRGIDTNSQFYMNKYSLHLYLQRTR